jgi:hypothetical protein
MNKCELAAALQAWTMAINHVAANKNTELDALNDLAYCYGAHISKPEHIDEVSHMFNWDKLINVLEGVQR